MCEFILAHFIGARPEEHDFYIQGIAWTVMGMTFLWFAYLWARSFISRKYHSDWNVSLVLAIVFFLFGADKAVDVLSIWYPLKEINTLLEGSAAILLISWLISQIKSKSLPLFLSKKEINEIDIAAAEKKIHSDRITNKLKEIKHDESNV